MMMMMMMMVMMMVMMMMMMMLMLMLMLMRCLQLRAFLQFCGAGAFFGESGAEQVMKIFDSDG